MTMQKLRILRYRDKCGRPAIKPISAKFHAVVVIAVREMKEELNTKW
jgi:hypothetical protein